MSVPAPHFLLHARAHRAECSGRWCFTLKSNDGSHSIKVEDAEPQISGERLELLALVRGLEALPRPAHVTVVATSPYLSRMLNGGLEEWRANGWRWEHHGEMVPVKNADLWRRIDRALHFHDIRLSSDAGVSRRATHRQPASASVRAASSTATGAHRARHRFSADRMLAPQSAYRRKSLARKVLGVSVFIQRRLRQCCRRWRSAIETMATEPDACAWAD